MSLCAGSKLGPYEIVAPLGAGGMGEVPCWTDEADLQFRLGLVTQPPLLPSGEFEDHPDSFSPDARSLAYTSSSSGRREVYVTPFPGPGGRIPISTHGGSGALWSRDGRELYYREGSKIMSVEVTEGSNPRFGAPVALFEASLAGPPVYALSYAPAPEQARFFIAESTGGVLDTIEVVLNWTTELERIVPTE